MVHYVSNADKICVSIFYSVRAEHILFLLLFPSAPHIFSRIESFLTIFLSPVMIMVDSYVVVAKCFYKHSTCMQDHPCSMNRDIFLFSLGEHEKWEVSAVLVVQSAYWLFDNGWNFLNTLRIPSFLPNALAHMIYLVLRGKYTMLEIRIRVVTKLSWKSHADLTCSSVWARVHIILDSVKLPEQGFRTCSSNKKCRDSKESTAKLTYASQRERKF